MVKYIIFDFDGTLVDSEDVAISVINQLADKHKFKKIEQEDKEYLRGLSIVDRCKFVGAPVYMLPFWASDFYNLYKHCIKDLVLFDGIKQLLDELNNKGYKIAVISSNSEHIIRGLLEKNNLDYIKEVWCSNKLFGKDKVIKNFFRAHKLKSSDVIYAGDEIRDIAACKKSGVKIIWVEWGFDLIDVAKKENPDYIANTPDEILGIVESI